MSTSLLYHAFGVRGYIHERSEYVGGEVLFRGEIHEVLYPFHRFLAEELAAGRTFPLWNPYPFFGYPWVRIKGSFRLTSLFLSARIKHLC